MYQIFILQFNDLKWFNMFTQCDKKKKNTCSCATCGVRCCCARVWWTVKGRHCGTDWNTWSYCGCDCYCNCDCGLWVFLMYRITRLNESAWYSWYRDSGISLFTDTRHSAPAICFVLCAAVWVRKVCSCKQNM